MKKRLLALVLVLCMMVSLMPFSAFADEGGNVDPTGETPLGGNDPVYTTYNVTINYYMPDGSIAAAPYVASLAGGTGYSDSVANPVVTGYAPTEPETVAGITVTYSADKIDYTVADIDKAYDINVYYTPAEVSYKIQIMYQDDADDGYTDGPLLSKTGLTGSTIAEVTETYDGYVQLPDYERPAIAADGSTIVEVKYDRKYYHMDFNLAGGYGVDPIYERYGAAVSVPDPQREGYTFDGWTPTIPATVPNADSTYTAAWKAIEGAGSYTVFFWYENANDTDYSLAGSLKVEDVDVGTVVNGATYKDADFTGKDSVHFIYDHADSNVTVAGDGSAAVNVYFSRKTYTLAFYECGIPLHTQHTPDCYEGATSETGSVLDPKHEGIVAKNSLSGKYYICINNTWYRYNGSVSVGNYVTPKDVIHEEHSAETGKCYQDGTTDTRIGIYQIKWQADVSAIWQNGVCGYPVGTRWRIIGGSAPQTTSGKVTVYSESTGAKVYDNGSAICVMLTMADCDQCFGLESQGNRTLRDMSYFVETLGGTGDKSFAFPTNKGGDGVSRNYTRQYHYDAYYGSIGNADEFVTIEGFTQYVGVTYTKYGEGNGSLSEYLLPYPQNPQKDDGNAYHADFYYLRNTYNITFISNGTTVSTGSEKFEASLADYTSVTPPYPAGYEGAYSFGGWSLTEGGEVYDLSTATMPVGGLTVYAIWEPLTFTVKVSEKEGDTPFSTENVSYDSVPSVVPTTPTREGYEFVGWFYKDSNGSEKAFDFNSTAVRGNVDVYAKWRGGRVDYTVYYQLEDGTDVAAPTTGKAAADTTKTFEAKGDEDLYQLYREGYFPTTRSSSITMSAENPNVVTFIYKAADAVPYTVKYLDAVDGTTVRHDEKNVTDNRKAVVTETFATVAGYLPDQFQKRLVLTLEGPNEIIFYYTKSDDNSAPYAVTHYYQDTNCTTYTEKQHSEMTSKVGNELPATSMVLTDDNGYYRYVKTEFIVDGEVMATSTNPSAKYELTIDGLEIRYYYDRIPYPYVINYEERGGSKLIDSYNGTAPYGTVVNIEAKTIPGYTPVAPSKYDLPIRVENSDVPEKNIVTFYYTENRPTIQYQIVGPDGSATLDRASETIGAVTGYNKTGAAQGATVTVNDGYAFLGWFSDEACTKAVGTDPKFVPAKGDDGQFARATYYAKVVDTFKVYFSSTGETKSYPVNGTVDLTALVHDGYLYGGYFKEYTKDGEFKDAYTASGAALTPVAGTTYVLKEISETDYFKPRLLVTSLADVHRAFLLTVADDANFKSFGYTINGDTEVSATAAFEQITFQLVSYTTTDVCYTVNEIRPASSSITEGSVVCIELEGYNDLEPKKGDSSTPSTPSMFTFIPYFVTMDGVKVSCPTSRRVSPNGTVYPNVWDTVGDVTTNMTVKDPTTLGSSITVYQSYSPYAANNAQTLDPATGAAPAIAPEPIEEEPEAAVEVIEEEAEAESSWDNFFNNISDSLKKIFG